MSTNHRIRTYSPAGVAQDEISDFESLACVIGVNTVDSLQVTIDGSISAIDNLSHKSLIEYQRKDPRNGIDWYTHFSGIYIQPEWEKVGKDSSLFGLTALGNNELLNWRHVMWYAETANRSKFTNIPAETIMKTLVDYNIGANATTANGRMRAGVVTGVSTQTDGANGTNLYWYCAWDNLLETLQALARVGGGDFNLVRTSGTTWEFRWYTGQLGTDRTSTVTFSYENGNMANPNYVYERLNEKTVAVAGGSDQGDERNIEVVTGDDYVTGPTFATMNDIEIFVNASASDGASALQNQASKRLSEVRAREKFSFDIIQTPASVYQGHYYLGDLVKVTNPFTGTSVTQKITGVEISKTSSGEDIKIKVETPL